MYKLKYNCKVYVLYRVYITFTFEENGKFKHGLRKSYSLNGAFFFLFCKGKKISNSSIVSFY